MNRVLASIVVVVSVCSGCGPERPAALEPVKIGTIGSTSGALATFGSALQDAIVLASENVNAAGGIFDGRPLELVIVDSTSDAAVAREKANELVEQGVVAIVGPETSGQSEQVLGIAENAKLPMVTCCATSTALSERAGPNEGFFFRTAPSDALQGQALAYAATQGVDVDGLDLAACPQAAFFSRGDSYGLGFKDVFSRHYQAAFVGEGRGRLIATGAFTSDAPSVAEIESAATAFTQAIVDNADPLQELCVVFITFGFEGARLVKLIEDDLDDTALGYHYLTGDGAQEGAFLQEIGTAPPALLPKIVGTVPFHAENAAYDEFAVAFEARHGSPPPAYSAQAFDAMFITALAVAKARSTEGVAIRNALFSVSGREGGRRFENGNFFGEIAAAIDDGDDVDYVGPSGDLTFSAVGDVQGDYVLWQVESVGGSLAFVDKAPLPVSQFAE
ncbi:MAG TPA: ABC transporter substrate-binding protein [Myxococcota bacterium]